MSEMGTGRTLREWEGLGILKTIPAHLYQEGAGGDVANEVCEEVDSMQRRRRRCAA